MPISYSSSLEEHKFVREKAGLFDVSHMGEIVVNGDGAEEFLNYALTNDIKKIVAGQAQYSLLCSEQGGTIDDLIIYKLSHDNFLLCVNASNIEKDYQHLCSLSDSFECEIKNLSDSYGQLAIQGPNALLIMVEALGEDIEQIKRMQVHENRWLRGKVSLIARTGYTGEDGFEIYCFRDDLGDWIELFTPQIEQQEIRLIGLAARDSLRLEAGFPLYGHELSDRISPLQAGLGWAVAFDKKEFFGLSALEAERKHGLLGKVMHYEVEGRRIPRSDAIVKNFAGNQIGKVLSGGFSPTLEKPVGTVWMGRESLPEFEKSGAVVTLGKQDLRIFQSKPVLKRD